MPITGAEYSDLLLRSDNNNYEKNKLPKKQIMKKYIQKWKTYIFSNRKKK